MTVSVVAKSAGRALGLLIAKKNGCLPFECYTKLYDSLVQPVIDYGASIWGTKEYKCIQAVQHRACRFFMGLGKYTPNVGIIGDMGWTLPIQRQWICVTRQWCRLINMDNARINKKVFEWSIDKSCHRVKNWSYRVSDFFKKLQMNHLLNIANSFDTHMVLSDMSSVLSEYYESDWYNRLMRVNSSSGQGQNKLRTYRKFKLEIKSEEYLKIYNKKHRSAIAKFRCGVAPIRLETGRYEHLEVSERICPVCHLEVESEEHVIVRCPAYSDIRSELFNYACDMNSVFNDLDDEQKLSFILSNCDICRISAKTCYEILQQRRILLYHT